MRFVGIVAVSALLLMTSACMNHRVPRAMDSSDHNVDCSAEELAPGIQNTVYFDYNTFALNPEYKELVARQAEWLKQHKRHAIVIKGYCDERGTREYNLALGASRANAVKQFLQDRGVEPSRMTIVSYGKDDPTPPRVTKGEEGYQEYLARNRKAVVTLQSGS